MDRRHFLKNSIGALLFGALTSNKSLASVVDNLTSESPKILLYLIQLNSGEWKIRATKWTDLPKKRLTEKNIIKDSFKPLEITDVNKVYEQRLKLWKEHNCTGRMGHLVSMGIPMNDEIKKEYSEQASKNHKGKKRSDIVKYNISKATMGRLPSNKGKTFSEESRKKMSESGKLKKLNQEHKENIRKWMLENNPFRGKKHTEETKKIILDKHPSKIKVTCTYCNRILDLPNYKRYHGEKCKLL